MTANRSRLALIIFGAWLLVMAASSPAPAAAQDLPPRPTVEPIAPTPTAPPDDDEGRARPSAPGRITGTVIDQRDGAPVSGARVQLGAELLTTDANGNYDRNGLPAGTYQITLLAAEGRGAPAQPTLTVQLDAGVTVVQHLAFLAPPALPAPEMPVVAPGAGAPVPAAPVAAPATLPSTAAPASHGPATFILAIGMLVAGVVLRRAQVAEAQ